MVRALASHRRGPGSIPGPGVTCGSEFVVGSRSCSECFSPGSPVFLPPLNQHAQYQRGLDACAFHQKEFFELFRVMYINQLHLHVFFSISYF